MTARRLRAYIYLLAVGAIWGAAGPIIKYTLAGLDPIQFLTYRFTIAAFFSIIFFLVKIRKGKKFRRLRANFPIALFYGLFAVPIALGFLFTGLNNSTVLDLSLINVIGPLLVTFGGAIFFHDHITHREKIGIAVVLLGVVLNSLYPIFRNQSGVRLSGNLLILLSILFDSSAVLIAKLAVKRRIKSANLTNLAFIIGAIIFIPMVTYLYGLKNFINMLVELPLKYHLGVWYMALASGSLAYYLYIRAQKSIEVSEAVLFNYLQPVFAIPVAVFWLKESITVSFIASATIIAVGLVIAESKRRSVQKLPDNQ